MKRFDFSRLALAGASLLAMLSIQAHAATSPFAGGTSTTAGNGSLYLLALDDIGPKQRSLVVDLGVSYNDFLPGGIYTKPGTQINWVSSGFRLEYIGVNGVISPIPYNNSGTFADFISKSDANEVKWAVVTGSQLGSPSAGKSGLPVGYFTTGIASAQQLASQTPAMTKDMAKLDGYLQSIATAGTLGSAPNGVVSAGPLDPAFLGSSVFGSTSANGWGNSISWNTWAKNYAETGWNFIAGDGTSTAISGVKWQLGGPSLSYFVAGNAAPLTFNVPSAQSVIAADVQAQALAEAQAMANALSGVVSGSVTGGVSGSFTTSMASPVPEPRSMSLLLAALGAIGFFSHRRTKSAPN